MAKTTYGVNDTLTVKLWAKALAREALKATPIYPLMGESADSIIQMKTETKKSAGDRITVGLRMQLTGDGVTENEVLEGNEEALTTYSDNLLINELAHAVRAREGDAVIDSQRILFNIRTEAKDGLKDWFAKRMSVSFFNQVCGNNATSGTGAPTSTKYTGLNAVVAPTSTRRIFTEAGATADQDLDATGDLLKLVHIDYAKELAETATPQIRPLMINGEPKYVFYMHPFQVTDLRTDAATAGNWFDIQKAAIQGGQISKNPIYTGALGEYNGVILRMSHDVPLGVNSSTLASISTVRRAVLLGAQSAVCAYGKGIDEGENSYKWVEETFDYRRELGVSVQTVMGLKKLQFNSTDFATVIVSSYAAQHNT